MKSYLVNSILLFLCFINFQTFAQIPQTLSYQGVLTDSAGYAVADGQHTILFFIYDQETAGTSIWEETHDVTTENGVFGVNLGSATPFNLDFDKPYWLEIEYNGDVLTPRSEITASAYSLNTADIPDSIVSAEKIASGNVVRSFNGLTDDVSLAAGANITLTPQGNTLIIAAADSGGGGNSPWIDNQNHIYYNQGNVGIGTNNPASTLDISGDLNISGSSTAGGTSTANIVSATTQFNIGNSRVLSSPGSFNFFAGNNAGQSTTGTGNSFFGVNNGVFNTTGNNNAFFGFEAGRNNNVGIQNSFFGKDAGRLNTIGNDNTFFGHDAGQLNSLGNRNTFVGTGAGDVNTIGNNNTTIGYNAEVGSSWSNATAIGSNALAGFHNSLVLGSVNGKNGATSDVNVGIGTTTPIYPLDIESEVTSGPNLRLTNYGNNVSIQARSAGGTRSVPIATKNNNPLFVLGANGYTGTAFSSGNSANSALIQFTAEENWTSTANGSSMFFSTTPNGTLNRNIRLKIDHNGRIAIGNFVPSFPLEMASGAHVTVGGVWTNASSRSYKENIHALSSDAALLVLQGLEPVSYNYKVDKEENYLGFIAEDVPDLVATQDRKSLSPMDIVTVLTKVVQQQQEKIAELESRLNGIITK